MARPPASEDQVGCYPSRWAPGHCVARTAAALLLFSPESLRNERGAPRTRFAGPRYGSRMPGFLSDDFDFVSTGWIRFMPEPAFNAYMAIWRLDRHPDGAVAGDLDELGAVAFDVESLGGFDAPYDAAQHADVHEEDGMWAERWARFVTEAERRAMPMRTPRDAIAFMQAVGLVERIEKDGEALWRPVVPVPLAEDVLELDADTPRREAEMRWHAVFQRAANEITSWLVDQRGDSPTTEVTITLTDLASRLDLEVDEARHGLANAMVEAGDIAAKPHPEKAETDEPIAVVVDWRRFDNERISVRLLTPPGDK